MIIVTWWAITLIALSISLNVLVIIFSLMSFGGSTGIITDLLFYVANWPSLLFHTYPYTSSAEGRFVYEAFGWTDISAFIANSIVWGVIGGGIGFRKDRLLISKSKPNKQTEMD